MEIQGILGIGATGGVRKNVGGEGLCDLVIEAERWLRPQKVIH